ncbi:Os03g0576600 [Oryza sativa Japonica Group]|nr:Os03g0576600 [Oryza sativa Japonica Group]|eukprot:NP_001050536.2 Os03g0576600 [Oryza sativa Japonica Group]
MGLQEDFEEYAEKVKTLPESTSNEDKLILYGLYKQATVGDVNTSRPGIFAQRDRAKWDAWKAVEGKSKEEAMSDYITKVKQLQEEAAALKAVLSVEISRKFDRNILQTCKFSGHGCPEKLPGQKSSNSSEFLVAGAH